MNNRGSALLLSYMTVAFLTTLSSAFIARSVSEANLAKRQVASEQALWIAEAGLNDALVNIRASSSWTPSASPTTYNGGTYLVTKVTNSSNVELKATGTYDNVTRRVKGELASVPSIFDNTVSVGGNMTLTGLLARVEVYGKTRIGGAYSKTWGASDYFADKVTGASADQTRLYIPDLDGNGTSNEFADFVEFGRDAVQSYDASEVVYVQGNSTVNIFPDADLIGKKVIFVEGTSSGSGDVNIYFDASWGAAEDLTVISTGTITYIEPLQFGEDARLSAVAWDDYVEASIFRSQHESVVYTHDDANFIDVLDWGSTTGNIIVNDSMSLTEVLTYEKYYFSDRLQNGDLPPGFDGFGSYGSSALASTLTNWQEW